MKFQKEPANYDRTNAVVLYLTRRYFQIAACLVSQLPESLQQDFRADTPHFTKKLADGIGLAEDPGQHQSFGLDRCRLIAEALVDAWDQKCEGADARLKMIHEAFEASDLDLSQPFLNRGSVDQYEWPTPVLVAL